MYSGHKGSFPSWEDNQCMNPTGYISNMDRLLFWGLEVRDCGCPREMLQKNGWQNWNLHQLSHFWPRMSGMEEDHMVRMIQSELA